MTVALINPNLVFQRNDPFTTGIVYMPISLAYAAAALRQAGHMVKVIDAFAERPRQSRKEGKFVRLGLRDDEVIAQLPEDALLAVVYAINLTNHLATVSLG